MNSRSKNIVLALVFAAFFIAPSFAQSIITQVDRDKISIGEQFTLELKVSGLEVAGKAISVWFNMPDTINHLEVIERSKIDTIEVNGAYTFAQKITVTSFDSGSWEIPSLSIVLTERSNNQNITQTTKPIPIEVLPVDVSQLKDYHDIKEILEVKEKNSPLVIGLIIALSLISLIAIYKLASAKKRHAIAKPVVQSNLSPLEWAMAELDKLNKEGLTTKDGVKEHYQRITAISRQFFYLQFHGLSLQQTTDEWMLELKSLPAEHDTKTAFFQLLRLADTVKFAKYLPPSADNEQAVSIAKNMIRESSFAIKNISNQTKTSAV